MNKKELIIIILLIIILVFIYLFTKRKENYCYANCSDVIINTNADEEECLSCSYCGVCTSKNGNKMCVMGTEEKPYFSEDNENCVNWKFLGVTNIDIPEDKIVDFNTNEIDYNTLLENIGQGSNTNTIDISKNNINYDTIIKKMEQQFTKQTNFDTNKININTSVRDKKINANINDIEIDYNKILTELGQKN